MWNTQDIFITAFTCLNLNIKIKYNTYRYIAMRSGDGWGVEWQTCDQKVLGLSPGRSGGRSADSYFGICSTPMFSQ